MGQSLSWVLVSSLVLAGAAKAQVLTGPAALGDWRTDAPGVTRRITLADLPAPNQTPSVARPSTPAAPPEGFLPKVMPGFTVAPYAKLDHPRLIRVAPNGDVFVAESEPGRIKVLRAKPGAAKSDTVEVFAEGLERPFGIAFYPAGPNPQWVYVAETDAIKRFPYRSGDMKARGAAETLVPKLTQTHRDHWTRDLVFSRDGTRMFVSVGSSSNVAEDLPKKTVEEAQAYDKAHGFGAAWGKEEDRADVLAFDPMGKNKTTYAAGIRNCVGLAQTPGTDQLWCSTNERDGLGDDLVPDYITRVKEGGFYGWPWYYLGDHEDPRRAGERPDLKGKAIVPDVLLASHSASLQMTFYPAGTVGPAAFPGAYGGQIFAAEHGSWNRSKRTGYKVIMAKVRNGVPTGEYQDFVTGFVADDASVYGRPVGVAVAADGALLFSDDGSGTLWRVAPKGSQ